MWSLNAKEPIWIISLFMKSCESNLTPFLSFVSFICVLCFSASIMIIQYFEKLISKYLSSSSMFVKTQCVCCQNAAVSVCFHLVQIFLLTSLILHDVVESNRSRHMSGIPSLPCLCPATVPVVAADGDARNHSLKGKLKNHLPACMCGQHFLSVCLSVDLDV